jgi:hypothetical protein
MLDDDRRAEPGRDAPLRDAAVAYIDAALARTYQSEVEVELIEIVEIWIFEGDQYAVDELLGD